MGSPAAARTQNAPSETTPAEGRRARAGRAGGRRRRAGDERGQAAAGGRAGEREAPVARDAPAEQNSPAERATPAEQNSPAERATPGERDAPAGSAASRRASARIAPSTSATYGMSTYARAPKLNTGMRVRITSAATAPAAGPNQNAPSSKVTHVSAPS